MLSYRAWPRSNQAALKQAIFLKVTPQPANLHPVTGIAYGYRFRYVNFAAWVLRIVPS